MACEADRPGIEIAAAAAPTLTASCRRAGNLGPMTTDVTSGGRAPSGRPYTVDYAVYAIVARCVFAMLAAFALYGARNEITRAGRTDHPEWSAARLHDEVNSALRTNLVETLVVIAMILILAKMIRDGRGWSRWVYTVVSVVPFGDVLKVTGLFSSGNLLLRLTYGMTGVTAIAGIVLLFLRPSAAYFRPAGVGPRVSPLAMLFRPKNLPPAKAAEQPSAPTVKKSQKPRAKSRKSAAE